MSEIKGLGVREQLAQMTEWVRNGKPFFHTRYNDGEFNAMFGLKSEDDTNCDGHCYFRDMGQELVKTFVEVVGKPQERLLIGSLLTSDPGYSSCIVFRRWLSMWIPRWQAIPWAASDLWVSPTDVADNGELEGLINAFRDNLKSVCLIGNFNIHDCRHAFLGCVHSVSTQNCWGDRFRLLKTIRKNHLPGTTYIWCAGFTSKVLSWKIYKYDPTSTHIDAGHLFDGIYGEPSREWLKNGFQDGDAPGISERRRSYYVNTLAPYIRSFNCEK